jgi:alpha-ribazole phosphatase
MSPEDAAHVIASQLPGEVVFDAIWSSPLSRCRSPAALLAAKLALPHRIDPRLLELSFGGWEGKSYEALDRDDHLSFRAWCDDWEVVAPPRGETLADLLARVGTWLRVAQESRAPQLVVAHAGVVRAVRVLSGRATPREAWALEVPHLVVMPG